jgi:hypothetical protein
MLWMIMFEQKSCLLHVFTGQSCATVFCATQLLSANACADKCVDHTNNQGSIIHISHFRGRA